MTGSPPAPVAAAGRATALPAHGLPATGLLAALMLPGLMLTGCASAPPTRPLLQVRSEPVRLASFSERVDTVATLEASEEVNLAAQAGGRILRLLVRQGQAVRRGQLLLELDQTQARAEVARLEAETETHRLNYRRFEYLVGQGAASAFQRDEYRQRYLSSRQELIARRADLAFRDLRAPIDGTVADLSVKVGDVIAPGDPFTRIVRNTGLQARLELPAVLAPRLRPGLVVQLLDPLGDRPLIEGRLRSLDPQVAPGSQLLLAKADLGGAGASAAGAGLRDGQRLRARLLLPGGTRPALPFAAVTRLSGQTFVFVVGDRAALARNPGRSDPAALRGLPAAAPLALQTPVRLGALQDGRYPVLSGVEEGSRVITSQLVNLSHGMPVTLR